MSTTVGQKSSQVKNSNQEDKSQATLQHFLEFIEVFNDPDPDTNRRILSEILTAGFKHRPHPEDVDYSNAACELTEALRDRLSGIIDNSLDDQAGDPGTGREESPMFDYSKLDEFLRDEIIPTDLAKGFTLLHGGFADLMAQAIAQANFHNITFTVPEYSTLHLEMFIKLFEIIRELKEVQS